ncbi:hypothetical protein FHU41_002320 [Psychromicrobium silvestre]|uniref:Lsr2 n=1 Tax=Psychromicrobium silvestre TaxID=1645614 RepID=A0A7Y9LUX1_9MICC|nr:Lsr2 family protein [Psychromicrobium silvestre]NYE96070.1 hypothetical protein [Psychromicrobium silvestre]
MAQKVNIILVDDLDGESADETIRFGLDGANYEIDLSTKHATELREALQPFVAVGRKTASRGPKARQQSAASRGNEVAQIRSWARENGHTVSDRGRIQADVVAAYHQANG